MFLKKRNKAVMSLLNNFFNSSNINRKGYKPKVIKKNIILVIPWNDAKYIIKLTIKNIIAQYVKDIRGDRLYGFNKPKEKIKNINREIQRFNDNERTVESSNQRNKSIERIIITISQTLNLAFFKDSFLKIWKYSSEYRIISRIRKELKIRLIFTIKFIPIKNKGQNIKSKYIMVIIFHLRV